MAPGDEVEMTRSHWYWRPGWKLGRRFYTWHVTFSGAQPELRVLVDHYREVIDKMPHLEALDLSGLHLTTQGVAFTDQVDEVDLDRIVECTTRRLANMRPLRVTLGPARTDVEGLFLDVEPVSALQGLRTNLRTAIADVWGSERVPEAEGFSPHVTLAYSDGAVPLGEVRRTLEVVSPMSVSLAVGHVSLIELNRDERRYAWDEIALIRLGS